MGIIPGDPHHYRAPLHAAADRNSMECPMYGADDLWCFKAGMDEVDNFDRTLTHIHDCSLIVEVLRFHRASALANQYAQEVRKLEEWMWEVGQLKEASVCQLKGANTLDRIDWAMREIGLWNQLLEDDVQHDLEVLCWCGCPSWKRGDVMDRLVCLCLVFDYHINSLPLS